MNDFNTSIESHSMISGPLIHLYKQTFEKLISTLAINFMEPIMLERLILLTWNAQ